MTARFNAALARLNQAVQRHLSDMVAVLDGVDVTGRFDAAYVQAFDGMGGTATALIVPSAACLTTTNTSVAVVKGVTYRVRSIQPDGTGETVLILERQP